MGTGRIRTIATVVSTVVVVQLAVGVLTLVWHVALDTPAPVYGYWLENLVAVPLYVLLTVLLLRRRPEHRPSWLFTGVTLSGTTQFSLGSSAHLLAALDRQTAVPALSVVASVAQMAFVLVLVALILYFPDGELPGRRWRPVVWVFSVGGVASMVSTLMVESTLPVGPGVVSPFAGTPPTIVGYLGMAGVITGLLGATASVTVRFRGSRGLERQQLRWFLASVIAGILFVLLAPWGSFGWAVGPALVPTGMAVAILRYRLYELDRLVSRTVTYAVVTLVLAGVYAGIVVGVQALTGPANAPDIVVAGATLAAAALFRPVRTRVQRLVDRRFNRSRYDADAVVGRFAERLRDELELSTVAGDLRDAVRQTLHPGQVGLWVRSADGPP